MFTYILIGLVVIIVFILISKSGGNTKKETKPYIDIEKVYNDYLDVVSIGIDGQIARKESLLSHSKIQIEEAFIYKILNLPLSQLKFQFASLCSVYTELDNFINDNDANLLNHIYNSSIKTSEENIKLKIFVTSLKEKKLKRYNQLNEIFLSRSVSNQY